VRPLAVLCLLLAACGPPAPTGPQPLGASSRAIVGDGEVELRYRYEPQLDREMVLYIDIAAKKGSVGGVEVTVDPKDFAVVSGETRWRGEVSGAQTATHKLTLRAPGKTASLAIVTRHPERDLELASDELEFVVTDDGIRECQPAFEGCE
jgi:hypothetical protein